MKLDHTGKKIVYINIDSTVKANEYDIKKQNV